MPHEFISTQSISLLLMLTCTHTLGMCTKSLLAASSPTSLLPPKNTDSFSLLHHELINTASQYFMFFSKVCLSNSAACCTFSSEASKDSVQKRSGIFFPNHYSPTQDVSSREQKIESEQKEIPPLTGEEGVKPITGDQSGLGEHCKPPQ